MNRASGAQKQGQEKVEWRPSESSELWASNPPVVAIGATASREVLRHSWQPACGQSDEVHDAVPLKKGVASGLIYRIPWECLG